MMVLSLVTIAIMTLGITSLAVGMGAIYPRFEAENVAKMASGFGGVVYMILSMIFVGLVVILESFPVYLIFMSKIRRFSLDKLQWIRIAISFFAVGILNVIVIVFPFKIGLKSLSQREF